MENKIVFREMLTEIKHAADAAGNVISKEEIREILGNLPLEEEHDGWEDKLITAKNKWLIGHPEGGLPEGAHIGLIGENVSVK